MACGGGGGGGSGSVTPAFRPAQNIAYLGDISNQPLMAASDDGSGSASPLSLLDVNSGSIVRNSIKLSPDGLHVAFNVIASTTSNPTTNL